MPRKLPLTKLVKARISSQLEAKLQLYCEEKELSESFVVREALKIFLRNAVKKCSQV